MNGKQILAAVAATGLMASAALGQSVDPTIEESSMFGVRMSSGRFWRYDFVTDTKTSVGYVRDVKTGTILTGIRGAAYFPSMPPGYPGFQQIHGFWLDPNDSHSKVVHVDVETGESKLTGIDLGEGMVRGATAVTSSTTATHPDGTTYEQLIWRVFAMQDVPEPETIPAADGMANLNPNNSANYEFTMTTPTGTYTRDHLHKNTETDEHGVFYEGTAGYVRFSPKGNGNQNSLILNGEPFLLSNGSVYEFEGDLLVRVFNDHIKNTKSMGHWWIGMDAVTCTVKQDGVVILSPPEPWVPTSRLFALHTETGLSTTTMELKRLYKGLATNDGGATFYTASGSNLYRIDPAAKTETLVGNTLLSDITGLKFVGTTLFAFDDSPDKLFAVDHNTGSIIGTGAYLGITDLGGIVFMPSSEVPKKQYVAFD